MQRQRRREDGVRKEGDKGIMRQNKRERLIQKRRQRGQETVSRGREREK